MREKKQINKWLKKEIDKYTIIVTYVINSPSLMYRTHRQKINKYIENLENTNNQLYSIDIIKVPPNENRI